MNGLTRAATWVTLILLASAIGLGFWWLVDWRTPYSHLYMHPVPVAQPTRSRLVLVEKPTLRPGEPLLIYLETCRPAGSGTVLRTVRSADDGAMAYQLPSVPVFSRGGCVNRTSLVQLPPLPPGRYVYQGSVEFQLNPFKTVTVRMPEVRFEVRSERTK